MWMNYNDLNVTWLECWSVNGIIPKWPRGCFQVKGTATGYFQINLWIISIYLKFGQRWHLWIYCLNTSDSVYRVHLFHIVFVSYVSISYARAVKQSRAFLPRALSQGFGRLSHVPLCHRYFWRHGSGRAQHSLATSSHRDGWSAKSLDGYHWFRWSIDMSKP